ncbi:MAG: SHOCT domain-containing protein [Bacteroidetes bacterium]|nr:SHOCT domain-containing protein [Bacteroidota bacterium]
MIIIVWIIGALLVAYMGGEREIGFWGAFAWSVILSPIIGLIIVLTSETNASIASKAQFKARMAEQSKQYEIEQAVKGKTNVADELLKFKELLDKGVITQEEFDIQKKKLL